MGIKKWLNEADTDGVKTKVQIDGEHKNMSVGKIMKVRMFKQAFM